MSAVSYHAQAAYDMQCALYRRWVRGERGPQIPPFDMMATPTAADRTRIEADERQTECPVCWGSHGCHLPAGHDGTVHRCIADPDELEDDPGGPCSEFDGTRARFWLDPGEWSEWRDGWNAIPGTAP